MPFVQQTNEPAIQYRGVFAESVFASMSRGQLEELMQTNSYGITLTKIKEAHELSTDERNALSAGKLYLKLPLTPKLNLGWMGLWSVATIDDPPVSTQGATLLEAVQALSKLLGRCFEEPDSSGVATIPGINPRKAPIQIQLGYTDDELDAFLVDTTRE